MCRIKVNHFGPLGCVDIPLNKPLQVFIGPQATGKSTLGKLVYFSRKIRDYLVDYAQQQITSSDEIGVSYANFLKYLRKPFIGYFGTTKHMEPFEIFYLYGENRSVKIKLSKEGYANFQFSDILREDISNLLSDVIKIQSESYESFHVQYGEQTLFLNTFRKASCRIFNDNSKLIYIPAGRNLLAAIPDLIQTNFGISQKDSSNYDISQVDLITQEFIQYIRQMRVEFGTKLDEIRERYLKTVRGEIRNKDVELAEKLIHSILKADYICDKEGERLYFENGKYVKLMFGSSGQQEILWALNIIYLAILKNEKTFLVLEEPESHLFPDTQESIAKLVTLLIGSSGSEVFLTTHSPYMLTSFNLLIYSGLVEKNGNAAIIERQYRIKPNQVASYLIPGAKEELINLIGEKRGLIDATRIDTLSDEINLRMNRLLQKYLQSESGGRNDM